MASDKDIFLKVLDENAKRCERAVRDKHAPAVSLAQRVVAQNEAEAATMVREATMRAIAKWSGNTESCTICLHLNGYGDIKVDRATFCKLAKADEVLTARNVELMNDLEAIEHNVRVMRRYVALHGVDDALGTMLEAMVKFYTPKK